MPVAISKNSAETKCDHQNPAFPLPVPTGIGLAVERTWWYDGSMKAKTSITLSMAVLVKIDKLIGEGASRSAFIEKVLAEKLNQMDRDAINRRDAAIINANADYLNREMEDVLRYQAPIEWTTEDN
jgi:hypothetical protein